MAVIVTVCISDATSMEESSLPPSITQAQAFLQMSEIQEIFSLDGNELAEMERGGK